MFIMLLHKNEIVYFAKRLFSLTKIESLKSVMFIFNPKMLHIAALKETNNVLLLSPKTKNIYFAFT